MHSNGLLKVRTASINIFSNLQVKLHMESSFNMGKTPYIKQLKNKIACYFHVEGKKMFIFGMFT